MSQQLLDDLVPTKARMVLMAPLLVEAVKWKAGGLEQRRQYLRLYTQAIREIADRRRAWQ